MKALFTFTYKAYICFVMEYIEGGDFGSILDVDDFLENDEAKFYIAEIILAINSLHKIGIVHRDIKPENILLDLKGHIKLTDFGLGKIERKIIE